MLAIDQIEIPTLTSPTKVRLYFKDISDLTRSIKTTETSIIAEFGFKSSQHDSILLVEESINRYLLLKAREYLSIHQYPRRIEGDTIRTDKDPEMFFIGVDVIASSTVIKIFVNAAETPENLDLNKLYFPKFYRAFEQGHIYSGSLWNLLYGMYRQEKGAEYVNLELGEDEQIEDMIDQLELKRKASN